MRNGHSIIWILLGITCFAIVLVPLVEAGTGNRQSMHLRQRNLERITEVHRLVRWAAAHRERELLQLPPALGAPTGAWAQGITEQISPQDPGALHGATVQMALERDFEGCRKLHQLIVELHVPGADPVRAERLVSVR